MELNRRIVITGIGVITPCGTTVTQFWDAVLEGKPTSAPLTRFDTSRLSCHLGSEIRGFEPDKFLPASKAKRVDRSVQYAVAASKCAIADAGLDLAKLSPDRVGVVEGTSVSGLEKQMEASVRYAEKGPSGVLPTHVVSAFAGGASSEVALELGVHCQATAICTACSAGNDALGYAARTIRDDIADVMIVGATEAPLVPSYYALFASTGAMSRHDGDPRLAMRPFDKDRCGFVIGEGAAFFVVEELVHAVARGARIYCEWVGHGQSCDAHSPIALHPEGRGLRRAIERALYTAQIPLDRVQYVNAHGSATESNDRIESAVLHKVFGSHARRLTVSATKPVTGHLMGATAAVEAAICALSIYHRVMPPTPNLEHPGEGCDLDYAASGARPAPVEAALNLNVGFGGKASAILLRRFPGG
jgi:3-oxoacyl-[acyl-carrier-protein] synthase II